jgi:DNA-binding response OmpR family regulator
LNIEVVESADVASGIQQMKDMNPDIVILDLHMPDKTGFEFMDIVHKNKRFAKTKVIMLTADDTMDNVFKAESKGIGVYNFLGKPFNISDLQALVLSLSLPIKTKVF